jgi:NitT/TauT family transport system permease protein
MTVITNSVNETHAGPSPRQQAGRPRKVHSRKTWESVLRIVICLAVPLTFLVSWEWAGQAKALANGLFPPISTGFFALIDWIFNGSGENGLVPQSIYSGTWVEHVGASITRILAGFGIGAILAVTLGISGGVSSLVRGAVDPMISSIRPISITAWVPLTLVIFGIGNSPAIFLTALASFFPIYVNTLDGARSVSLQLIRAAEMLGANRREVITRVVLPAALPSIVTGLRVAIAIAWTTVVIAEMLGAKSGLGYVLIDSYNQFRFDYVIAGMISLGAMGFLTEKGLKLLFAHPLRWVSKSAR